VVGQTVHLTGYFGLLQVSSQAADLEEQAKLHVALEQNAFLGALFLIPFLLCALGAPIPQAIGLRRARVLSLWACIAVVLAAALMLTVSSTP
jgi:hypothetical protein